MRRILLLLAASTGLAPAAGLLADDDSGNPALAPVSEADHRVFSGIYPHLALFNHENECGTGAVVPWADRLWVITYAPHKPGGSTDKLYEIDDALALTVRPESVGGTPANRMIHRESNQLIIGPYVIDAERNVRVIPPDRMFGRLTGTARHLTDPSNRVYFATMEEGIYEVDVHSLEVTTLFHDEQTAGEPKAALPGYHGKGLYSGQGRLVYANNGEKGPEALRNPFVESGALAEWTGQGDWAVVTRRQFTEVTGPGGIHGNAAPATDPVWSIGWDARSLILMLLEAGRWHRFRLPKASHSYDGAHGWNTEWPRIREIGEDRDLLMTMHGMFWRFPRTFSVADSAGIAPRSTYLKVVGDFCRWKDHIVLGCDDAARSEFLNKRRAKGEIAGPQSQSNLWFIHPDHLDHLGPVIGRGAVWLDDPAEPGTPSDPMLVAGFRKRALHLIADHPTTFLVEGNSGRDAVWVRIAEVVTDGYAWLPIDDAVPATWIRVVSTAPLGKATAWFAGSGVDDRGAGDAGASRFGALARPADTSVTGGIVRARGGDKRTLHFAAINPQGGIGYYELDAAMNLRRIDDPEGHAWLLDNAAIPPRDGVLTVDEASVLYIDDSGRRFRLPKGDPAFDDPGPLGWGRLAREVATERDLFNCHGSFYELPAENAGGFAKVRPVATHNRRIFDYCSYRGLLVVSGLVTALPPEDPNVIRSDDGRTALWVGAIDDLWTLGKPGGRGGPWLETPVEAGGISDPYLMTGYDRKTLTLSSSSPTRIDVEIDIAGTGKWVAWKSFALGGDRTPTKEVLPEQLHAYWIRFRSMNAGVVTAQLVYE